MDLGLLRILLIVICISTIHSMKSNRSGRSSAKSSKESSNSGGSSGASCSPTCISKKDCGDLPQVGNGEFKLLNGSTCRGCQAILMCDSGYDTSDLDVIKCVKKGPNSSWGSSSCMIKDCGPVSTIANAVVTLNGIETTFGATASVTCNICYSTTTPEIECLATGVWSYSSCIIKECNAPEVVNGDVCLPDLNCGTIATVICDPGYTPTPATIECKPDGSFASATCDPAPTSCTTVPSVNNGNVVMSNDLALPGDTAFVVCELGYVADPGTLTCINGSWDQTNVSCNPATCPDTPITDATPSSTDEGAIGDTITFTCATGFESCDCFSITTCVLNVLGGPAEWSPKPECTDIDCGVPQIPHGTVDLNEDTLFGMTANVTCKECFTPTNTALTCTANGWSAASCCITACTEPTVTNGNISFSSLKCGATAAVNCDHGYTPSPNTIECRTDGSFDTADCVPRDCGQTPTVLNGEFVPSTGTFGTKSTLICNCGFIPMPETSIHCLSTGVWSTVNTLCQSEPSGGNTFYTVFPKLTRAIANSKTTVYITTRASGPVNVRYESPHMAISGNINVVNHAKYEASTSFILTTHDIISDKVIKITSDEKINIHTMTYRISNDKLQIAADSFLNLDTNKLSDKYVILATTQTAQFSCIGITDGTYINITLANGMTPFTKNLDEFDVYTFFNTGATLLTGTVITSNNDIACVSGGSFATVPSTITGSKDLNAVMLLGCEYWPTTCFISPFLPRKKFAYTVVAHEQNTFVNITTNSMTTTTTLASTASISTYITIDEPVVFQSNKPILVALFSVTEKADSTPNGDSSMVLCLDPRRFLNIYTFRLPEFFDKYYLRVTIESQYKDELRLNGNTITPSDSRTFTVPGSVGVIYSVIYVDSLLQSDFYILETENGALFGAETYGAFKWAQYTHNLGYEIRC